MIPIDLRSDTVTLPSEAMKQAMVKAELGDDVIDVDPTLDKMEKKIAELLGKEAAIFMPSGTMTNQIAIRVHCRQGDEVICEAGCHIYNYEQAGFAQLTGVVAQPVSSMDYKLTLEDVQDKIRPENEHMARTRLICIENTHNRGGGSILPIDNVRQITEWARGNGLATHLDGARLFNAVVASGIPAKQWASHFDTVSVCFSKGLGAPIGSALAGSAEQIRVARRHRKLLGGGMRQAGIIAAAVLYAIEQNIDRLADDHHNAKIIADAINQSPKLLLEPASVETNIVIFRVNDPAMDAATYVKKLESRGIRTLAFGSQHVRAVTHLQITRENAEFAAEQILACPG
ncbi:MAG: low-specificity L-threonine aldolase [Planctomycetota bacterium]|nr:low-specificity L-threonine aldolase [Planctomycetota bacterium]